MRIAALAFGILAGLVASFILALGGLDASELVHFDARQAQLVAFVLFVIANLGVLGAGLVLAAPIAGASLFVLGALGWLAAAIVLRHGPDYVMLTSPALLAVAAILAGIAVFRRHRRPPVRPRARRDEDDEDDDRYERRRAAPQRRAVPAVAPRRLADEVVDEPDDADEAARETDDRGSISVGASFFGDAGTAMPLRGAMPSHADEKLLRGLGRGDRRSGDPHDWQPVRRRVEPPRQKPMFRPPEDEYEDEESGLSQFARISSGVLSFGLYATLAVAVLLVIFSLREGNGRATATRIEASASTPSAPAPVSSSAAPAAAAETPAIAPALPAVELPSAPPSPPVLARPGGLAVPAAGAAAPVIATAPSVPAELRAPAAQPQPAQQQPFAYPGVVVADGPSLDSAAEPPPALAPDDSASTETPADSQAAAPATTPVPFPMPAAIAAQRVGRSAAPAAQRSQPAPRAATGTDTGL
ncbi:MAG: hypothetical protein BGO82_15345 [Devosia sp. 67-54]|uniref:hypothetical protein n=1 Tax=unclassified Devosia TaxID=196773 RepID=UPI00095AE2C2|nr:MULTISPECIES: hypothetical protein [unclassified Devosia]MBN9303744.1 hypothetical protein [Devosia sp.]OJX17617.1 MAG: hypothetical protein BGO82_15345 [Devosia sp. 67-54]